MVLFILFLVLAIVFLVSYHITDDPDCIGWGFACVAAALIFGAINVMISAHEKHSTKEIVGYVSNEELVENGMAKYVLNEKTGEVEFILIKPEKPVDISE